MFRIGFVLCLVVLSCKGKKSVGKEGKEFSYEKFSELFRPVSLPYQLTDTGLINNRDTTAIRSPEFAQFISDSAKAKIFGKGARIKYIALGSIKLSSQHNLYLVKGSSGSRRAALLFAFEKDQFAALFPFLVPDSDPSTSQASIIDRSSITKNIVRKQPRNVTEEGKDVYAYDPEARQFSLVLTNPLGGYSEIINPIDTLPRTRKFTGDYAIDKKNFISIRDGRTPNQLLVFMHLEKNEGDCTGELKGDLLLTSTTTAIYRQGGDPCVLSFRFTNSAVVVKEDEGCGSHRGLDCSFDGIYNRKKQQKQKPASKKTLSK
jgi:hypothetical protein